MFTTVRYILLTASRDWLFYGVAAAVLAAMGVASFLGVTSLVEEEQMKLVFSAGSARLILAIGMIVFVCFHVRAAFQNKEIDLMISRPISRAGFIVAYWLGFAVIATALVVVLSIVLGLLYPVQKPGIFYWAVSMWCEQLLVVAFSLFAALILRSAVSSVLLCFGFYTVTRMLGFFLYILEGSGKSLLHSVDFGGVTGTVLSIVSAVLPRLDLMANSNWLVYAMDTLDVNSVGFLPETLLFLPQTLIYVPLLLAMAIHDFSRKQF